MGGRPAGVAHQVPAPRPGQAGGGHQPRQQHQELQAEAPSRHQEGRCADCAAHLQGDYQFIFRIYTRSYLLDTGREWISFPDE